MNMMTEANSSVVRLTTVVFYIMLLCVLWTKSRAVEPLAATVSRRRILSAALYAVYAAASRSDFARHGLWQIWALNWRRLRDKRI